MSSEAGRAKPPDFELARHQEAAALKLSDFEERRTSWWRFTLSPSRRCAPPRVFVSSRT